MVEDSFSEERMRQKEQIAQAFAVYREDMLSQETNDCKLFNQHFKEEWLEEKYKPSVLVDRLKGHVQSCHEKREQFKSTWTDSEALEHSESSVDESVEEYTDNALMLRGISQLVPRSTVESVFSGAEGLSGILLSDPSARNGFKRAALVVFKTKTQCIQFHSTHPSIQISGVSFDLFPNTRSFRKRNTTPSLAASDERILHDLEQAIRVADRFDDQKHFEIAFSVSPMVQDVSSPVQKLDMVIAYLRAVHLFCYYCAAEFKSQEELESKCSVKHLRGEVDGMRDIKWASQLDQSIDNVLRNLNMFVTREELHEYLLEDLFYGKIHSLSAEKTRCGECQKLFRAEEFVRKHFMNKHPTVVKSHLQVSEKFYYFVNFKRDKDRPKSVVETYQKVEKASPLKVVPSTAKGRKLVSYENVSAPKRRKD